MAFFFPYYSKQIAGDARRTLNAALLNRCSYDERMAILGAVAVREFDELTTVQRVAHLAACYDACVRLNGHAGWFSQFKERTLELRDSLDAIGAAEQKNILVTALERSTDVPGMQMLDAQYAGINPAINPDLILAYIDANATAFLPDDTGVNAEAADSLARHINLQETAAGLRVSVANSSGYLMRGMPRSSFIRIYVQARLSSPYEISAGDRLTAEQAANLTDLIILNWIYFYSNNEMPVHITAEDYEHPYSWRIIVQFTEGKFGQSSPESYEAAAYFLGKSPDEVKSWHEGDQYMQDMR